MLLSLISDGLNPTTAGSGRSRLPVHFFVAVAYNIQLRIYLEVALIFLVSFSEMTDRSYVFNSNTHHSAAYLIFHWQILKCAGKFSSFWGLIMHFTMISVTETLQLVVPSSPIFDIFLDLNHAINCKLYTFVNIKLCVLKFQY